MNNDLEITNKLLFEMVKNLKQTNKNLSKAFIATVVCLSIIIVVGIAGFFWYESQFEVTEQTQTELSLEQEASGEQAEINNVLGNMYKDNATHNEGK
jgi:uncharacterized protein (UPF0333 family)